MRRWSAFDFMRYTRHVKVRVRVYYMYICDSLDCNSNSAKLKRQVMARVINPQNRRPQRSSSNVSNSPAGSSVAQAREKDTNTELGISLREYTWPSKAIIVKDLERSTKIYGTLPPYTLYTSNALKQKTLAEEDYKLQQANNTRMNRKMGYFQKLIFHDIFCTKRGRMKRSVSNGK